MSIAEILQKTQPEVFEEVDKNAEINQKIFRVKEDMLEKLEQVKSFAEAESKRFKKFAIKRITELESHQIPIQAAPTMEDVEVVKEEVQRERVITPEWKTEDGIREKKEDIPECDDCVRFARTTPNPKSALGLCKWNGVMVNSKRPACGKFHDAKRPKVIF